MDKDGVAAKVDIVKFWGNVWKLKNAVGEQPYAVLASYVLSLLTIPLSNAVVERLFSLLLLVKTKQRNRISLRMLESI